MNLKFFEKLIATPSPSGNEAEIQKLWINEMKKYADITTDEAGNATASLNKDASYGVLFAAHCDEISFMVKHIDDSGYITVSAIGGISAKPAIGSRVRIYGKKMIKGVVAVPPEHKGGQKGDLDVDSLTIDTGAKDGKELRKIVRVGDYVLYDLDLDYLQDRNVMGRALDNRTGLFIMSEVVKALSKEKINVAFHAVSTVNEETNQGGAYFATSRIQPKMAIACDVTFATDDPTSSKSKDGDVRLGGGPVLAHGPQVSRKINEMLEHVAKKSKLNVQFELAPRRTGTDADTMRFTGTGVPVALISLPLRYMHSPSEVVSLKDMEAEIKLIVEFVRSLNGDENLSPLS
ncbi:MAG: M20/M25/M40 family metallo-hydrolase [Bacillota bacterium]|nr:M20/M25/M40 family metallo-hydrolase [Bacillota bacterium]